MNPVVIKSYLVPEGTLREGGFRLEVKPVAFFFKEADKHTPDEMGNYPRIVASYVRRWTAYLIPSSLWHWLAHLFTQRTNENSKKTALTDVKTENDELKQQLGEKEKELEALIIDNNDLRTRNDELHDLLRAKEKDLETFRTDYNDLRTRLSEMGAMQLTEGNPNITDLSDQNRPDKIAEQFSELYDNQWTDCYMVLMDRLMKTELETVEKLLTILKTVYDISLNRSQEIMSDARKVLVAFAGMSDGESEKALDSLIQETLHKMKSYRTKHFKAVPKDIATEINDKLVETIGEEGVTACNEYIEACVRICWLMCIKDPPMYIFCEKEDIFNKNHFMEYTEKGHKVSYVVWPVLYLYKNGPLMRKGVAQGEGKQIEDSKVAVTEYGSPKSNEYVEMNSQFSTGTSEMVQPKEDYEQHERNVIKENQEGETELTDADESQTVDDEENRDGDRHVENVLMGVHTPVNVASSEEHEHELFNPCGMNSNNSSDNHGDDNTLEVGAERQVDESGKQEDVGINMQLLALTGHKAGARQHIHDKLCFIEEHEQIVIKENQEGETELTDADEIQTVEDEEIRDGDRHIENVLMGVHTPVNVSPSEEHEHELSNPCGMNSNNSSDNHGDDNTLEVGAERQVDESGKQEDVGINVQLLALTGHKAGARQHIHDKLCFIEEHEQIVFKENQEGETELTDADEIQTVEDEEIRDGDRHVENVLMGVHTPVNVSPSEEHEHELSNPCGRNSNNSFNNHRDDSTLEVGQKNIVHISIAASEKTQEDKSGKVVDAVMSIHGKEMELGKKKNDIVLLENETRTVENARDMDAPNSLNERCNETEERIVSPSNDKDRPEVNVKEENLGVADVCSLSENSVPGENDADDYNRNVAFATDDDVANPTVELQKEKHHQGKLSKDSSVEGK